MKHSFKFLGYDITIKKTKVSYANFKAKRDKLHAQGRCMDCGETNNSKHGNGTRYKTCYRCRQAKSLHAEVRSFDQTMPNPQQT